LLGKRKDVILVMFLVVGGHRMPRRTQMLHHLSLDHVTAAHRVVGWHYFIRYFFVQVIAGLVRADVADLLSDRLWRLCNKAGFWNAGTW